MIDETKQKKEVKLKRVLIMWWVRESSKGFEWNERIEMEIEGRHIYVCQKYFDWFEAEFL